MRRQRRLHGIAEHREQLAALDTLLSGLPRGRQLGPGQVVDGDLAAVPRAPAGLHARLEQRELVRPGGEAARSPEAVELAEDRHQCVVRGLHGEILDLRGPDPGELSAPAPELEARRPQEERVQLGQRALARVGRPLERRDPLP